MTAIGETSLELPDDAAKEKLKSLNLLLEKANEVNDALSQMGFRNKYISVFATPFFQEGESIRGGSFEGVVSKLHRCKQTCLKRVRPAEGKGNY